MKGTDIMNTKDLKNPYYCKCHKIFLDKEYIERKQCLNRLSADMMCRNRCFNVLNTIELTKTVRNEMFSHVISLLFIVFLIGIMIFFISLIGDISDTVTFISSMVSATSILFGLILILVSESTIKEVPTGEYEYQVTIDESVSMVDFTSKYDIIRVDGEIYTIREKEKE